MTTRAAGRRLSSQHVGGFTTIQEADGLRAERHIASFTTVAQWTWRIIPEQQHQQATPASTTLQKGGFGEHTQALNIAKTFPLLAAAIEAYKQENEDVVTTPSSKSTTRAGNGQRTLCQRLGEADCRLQPPLQHRGQPNVQDLLGYLGACNACPLS
ncbi:hypothetical protein HaLaN_29782 [Haematococcus lacustris]|uniref:Uncharacterized protein n=1 Tax=Haematococcus lacustris TaxID=44745 RepID=A0A6A0AFM3_HAELA|nr:hypothetical protein HaLaN_29782 [Haematococcus lacustris]